MSSQTIQRALNKTGFRAVVKARRPGLSKCHHRERLDFAKSHQHWALEGWKRLIWSDGRKWVWKKSGKALVTGWLREQSSLEVDIWAVLGGMGQDMPEK